MKLKICEDEKELYLKLSNHFIKKYDIKANMSVDIIPIDKDNFRMIINKKGFKVKVK